MLMMQTTTTLLPTTIRFSLLTSIFGYASKSVRLGGSHKSRTLLSSKLRSVDAFVAAHKSSPSSVGMAFKVRHFLRSLGCATKLVDSDRVRFAEPEGVICLHTCRRRWKHFTAPQGVLRLDELSLLHFDGLVVDLAHQKNGEARFLSTRRVQLHNPFHIGSQIGKPMAR